MRVTVTDVTITHELLRRPSPAPDYLREKLALQDLAAQMGDRPEDLLPDLVRQAMDICNATSAGISVLEGAVFRWVGLAGRLAAFEGATTPRDFSPCGICIDNSSAVLMQRPERVYGWIADTNVMIPEVLLVPLMARGHKPIGTLWVVAEEGQHFNAEHERVMTDLAAFTGAALRMVQSEGRLKKALEDQEMLTREISHRIKNLFAVVDGVIRTARRETRTKDEMADAVLGRIRALSDATSLVRPSIDVPSRPRQVSLAELIATILAPFRPPTLSGPDIRLGEPATNSLALILHELATCGQTWCVEQPLRSGQRDVGDRMREPETDLGGGRRPRGGASVEQGIRVDFAGAHHCELRWKLGARLVAARIDGAHQAADGSPPSPLAESPPAACQNGID